MLNALAKGVQERLKELEKGLPDGTEVRTVYDQSTFIAAAIGEVKEAALIGGLLAVQESMVRMDEGDCTANNVTALQFDCDSDPSRTWKFSDVTGSGVYQIKNADASELARTIGATVSKKYLDQKRKDPKLDAFREAFRKRWGAEPDTYAAHAYDGANMLLWASHNLERMADRVTNICDRTVFEGKYKYNSKEYIWEHMKLLRDHHGVRHVTFYDDLFTTVRERIVDLCELLLGCGYR